MGVGGGVCWGELAADAPELVGRVHELVRRYGFALIGTIRADGTPRISAVETHVVRDDLTIVMLPKTRKARDVLRDARVTLQSPIVDAADPGAEYKLRGRAVPIEEEERRSAAADVVEASSGWRPRPTWLFLALAMTHVTHTLWSPDGTAEMTLWSADRPAVRKVSLGLDWELGGYRPVEHPPRQ